MATPRSNLPLAMTMGEPAGIGGEIALKAWQGRDDSVPPFFLIDDPARLTDLARLAGLNVAIGIIDDPTEAPGVWATALPVLPLPMHVKTQPGRPDIRNAAAVVASIEHAVKLLRLGQSAAMVTNPIQKETLYAAGFQYPGHTEFLAALAGPDITAIMMLACDELRVVPVTIHIPLSRVATTLTIEMITTAGRITAAALRDRFGIAQPRLAVAGLNPHAGENGTIGDEEARIILPALEILRAEGIEILGPLSADTMFHPKARRHYDAALCMYHDQGLIPIKTIDFDGGVNVTLGLPFIRTSPDHGTALDIAGTGAANPQSLIAALRLAARMVLSTVSAA